MAKKGYWIAHVNVTNPERYKDYIAANAVAFRKYNGRFLIRGGESVIASGELGGRRHVVIEFDSFAIAKACHALRRVSGAAASQGSPARYQVSRQPIAQVSSSIQDEASSQRPRPSWRARLRMGFWQRHKIAAGCYARRLGQAKRRPNERWNARGWRPNLCWVIA